MSIGETYVAVQGWIGSDINVKEVSDGLTVCSFRLATTPRQFDRASGGWTDRPTNWFTVECWRNLATNVRDSMERGQPIVVAGRFRTTEWQDESGNPRSRIVIEATAVGHDLTRGTATFIKSSARSQLQDTGPIDQDGPNLVTPLQLPASESAAETHEAA